MENSYLPWPTHSRFIYVLAIQSRSISTSITADYPETYTDFMAASCTWQIDFYFSVSWVKLPIIDENLEFAVVFCHVLIYSFTMWKVQYFLELHPVSAQTYWIKYQYPKYDLLQFIRLNAKVNV